ncbi:MAG: Re/Si-specific NAD(P)(+) transhydrogenase subunit alpha [Cyclobacteriaceae bacterium]|nr:Re/Si-specific NAD(P)(+) transhydrogenase subunit alpha [Cyclobacteriaceae bacterium]
MAKIFIPKEIAPRETRVASTPDTVKRYIKTGHSVFVEQGAGLGAHITDDMYIEAGATIVPSGKSGWSDADVVLKVRTLDENREGGFKEIDQLKEGAILIGLLAPYKSESMVSTLAQRKISALSMELVPRISRAQSMDALSSQANIAGYKAVLLAANRLEKYFPQLMTAAGTVRPAKVVIIGAGVAGLQAVATAKRLGALVEVSDIRPEVKEQVQSLGARYIEPPSDENGAGEGGYAREVTKEYLAAQQKALAEHIALADVVITTALVPGRPAPKIVSEEMVKSMKAGSVIVDLAVEEGGNCELSEMDQEVTKYGVHIIGTSNLPATVSKDAANLYARNVFELAQLFLKEGGTTLPLDDEVIKGALITHSGEVYFKPFISQTKEEKTS